ncbi:response regulator [Nostoc sp. FACHB-152]|uniref:ATP-binding protein n=1 Tax=unclassified Nostoc TaxID=2593658 RepID=UPI001683A412|nr:MULTISPECIES: ATP-binding protein [unclassified Nostoc]MBD2448540.1 response regulator [Nostoc sp. FACHB-152]MBD2466277.1 response regulator [Nostoc sp. FACHB-145]
MQPSDKLNITEFVTSEPIDLTNCDREPIHIPGLIQPHGILLTLSEPQLEILQVSENIAQLLGITAESLLGQPLTRLLSPAKVKEIAQSLKHSNLEVFSPLELRIHSVSTSTTQQKMHSQNFKGILHRSDGVLVLELEPSTVTKSKQLLKFYHLLKQAIAQIRQTETFNDLVETLVKQVRQITGFDRVMVYQFATDNSGIVVAEDKAEHLETYLDLHYPASDIPQQARQLYYENWLRLIPNANYQPAKLIPTDNPVSGTPLNLGNAHLRSVSPLHIEYLQHMGVTASMSISLINEKRLWGLIACHHYTPKYVDYETRKACEFLGQFASVELVYQQEQDLNRYRSQVKAIQEQLRQAFGQEVSFIEPVLRRNEVELLNLVHAQGAAIILDNEVSLLGQTPSSDEVQALMSWLSQQERQDWFVTDSLSQLYPQAKKFAAIASGILAISIIPRQKSYHIVWFRPEQIQTVNWAGDPHKPVSVSNNGEMRLTPRKSFQLWKQTVQATSLPWQPVEIEAALEMRNTFMLAVLEFSQVALEQAAERAAIANRAKSQFLAKMSHELRTPLNAILGFTQLMARTDDTPSEFREHLSIISRSGEHLLTLINDVLEMSRIEAGQLILTESYFNLHRLLSSIKDMFALRASEKGLNLTTQWDTNLPCYVYGDEAKLRQILINLLGNAIKFTTKGTITLRVRTVLLSDSATSQIPIILHLEVEDTGCGIAPTDIESVFEAFMQTQRGRHAQGTGLGLSISRQFARLMGGDITVQSTLNQGSTFKSQVLLHLADLGDLLEPEVIHHVIGLEPGQPTYRILVAEDVLENRQLLIKLLQSVGFEVCAVENGKEAIAKWLEWQPHLIWMDIQMPVMDGYTATQQIRANQAGKDVVIIALTASAFKEDRIASLQAGCNDHLAKPFTETALFEKMARYLGVRYLYAEETISELNSITSQPKALTFQDLQVMPSEWICQMHEAALDLNDIKLYELIAQISPQSQPLADTLKSLVDNFQLEAIATLTQC